MYQLKFSKDYSKIIDDIPFWKDASFLPSSLVKFIQEKSDQVVIYESSSQIFYCASCLETLKENECPRCHRTYVIDSVAKNERTIKKVSKILFTSLKDLTWGNYYFAFDIQGPNVYLYLLEEINNYENPLSSFTYRERKINIERAYFVTSDGLFDLQNETFTSYQELDSWNQKCQNSSSFDFPEAYENICLISYPADVYLENLEQLKSTFYKYTKLWDGLLHWQKEKYFSIANLTMVPLFYPAFEYLINYQLYSLAFYMSSSFDKKANFKEMFGIDKSYLPFMQKYDIEIHELKTLQLCPTLDYDELQYFSQYSDIYYFIWKKLKEKYGFSLKELKTYLDRQQLSHHEIPIYMDYLRMAEELQLDLKEKLVLYPSHLMDKHDQCYTQIKILEDPTIEEKIKKIANALELNSYEDDTYKIYPVSSMQELIQESKEQKNCVRTYCKRIANQECQVYLMRRKENVKHAFVTIEVVQNKIVQARLKYNKIPEDTVLHVLRKWEKTLLPIQIEE